MTKNIAAVFVFLFLCAGTISAQINPIQNAGFEKWNNLMDSLPDYWYGDVNGTIYRTTDAHSGTYALGGKVVAGGPDGVSSPDIFTSRVVGGFYQQGFQLSFRPALLEGYYKFTKVADDELLLFGWLFLGQKDVGSIIVDQDTASTEWRYFSLPFQYRTDDVPDDGNVSFSIVSNSGPGHQGHIGSSFVIDDVRVTGFASAGVGLGSQQLHTSLKPCYPNPASDAASFNYTLAQDAHVRLEIFNLLSEKVVTIVDQFEPVGEHQHYKHLPPLANGIYCYRLTLSTGEVISRLMEIER